jgi:hypothetical protein
MYPNRDYPFASTAVTPPCTFHILLSSGKCLCEVRLERKDKGSHCYN